MPNSGPSPCDILFVGEAFGKEEDVLKLPFIGAAGKELRRELADAGFNPGTKHPFYSDQAVRLTNVFMRRPGAQFDKNPNDLSHLCGKRGDVPKAYDLPPISSGQYLLPEHFHHLDALRDEILSCSPKLIVALGNTACWALLKRTGISKLRGALFPNELVPGGPPVLPTFHPSAVLHDWSNRVIVLGDLIKAKRYLDEGGLRTVRRELWLEPSLDEVREFLETRILLDPPRLLSFDVETLRETITCIGFAPSSTLAITIPLFDPSKPDRNYWPTLDEELAVRSLIRRVLASPIPKLGQNGLYDIQYCLREGWPVHNYLHDTMIRHHSLHPELEKGLGFMATLYTDEAPWKVLRDRNKDNFKIDDE